MLGWMYDEMGEYAKTEPLFQEALRIRQKVCGPEDPPEKKRRSNTEPV